MDQDMHASYKSNQQNAETVRETEARALLSCASLLENVRANECTREEFGNAVRHNQKLWTFFQVSLCEPDNKLPHDLKILLLNLSRYVDKVSFRVLTDKNTNSLHSLININRMIAAGLSKRPEDAAKDIAAASFTSAAPTAESMPQSISTLA